MSQDTSDAQLVDRCRLHDPQAATELVTRYQGRLFGYLRRMVGNQHDVEDLVQHTFMKAFSALDDYQSSYPFTTWLFTIAHRLALDHLDKRRRRKTTAQEPELFAQVPDSDTHDHIADVDNRDEHQAQADKVWAAVQQLSEQQRSVVLLFYRQGLTYEQVSQATDLPVGTIKSLLHRARQKLTELCGQSDSMDSSST